MKRLLIAFALLCAIPVFAADIITATVTITNAAGTTNGETITVNANVRTFTNSVWVPSAQILTNATPQGTSSNLFNQVALNPYSGLQLSRYSTNGIVLKTSPGGTLSVTLSSGLGEVVYTTNTLTDAVLVRIPVTVETAGQQTNVSSGLVRALNLNAATNTLNPAAPAMAQLVGTTNTQTISGVKAFTNTAGVWNGAVSNSPSIGGTAFAITNGYYTNAILDKVRATNFVNYGNAISSPGSGGEQFGSGATATAGQSLAVGSTATASAPSATAIGDSSIAGGNSSLAIGASAEANFPSAIAIGTSSSANYTNATAIGAGAAATRAYQVTLGTASDIVSIPGHLDSFTASGTNNFPANSDIAFARYANSSLANGNNAAVAVGTNVFVEVSGPTSGFTINGIAGGRDGKMAIILNQTGQNMTIANDSGVDPTAGNRIYTMTGADRATTGNGAAILIYSGNASRWILISLDP